MSEPSDEELTRALARLAGIYDNPDWWVWVENQQCLANTVCGPAFSPLTDPRDLWPLVVDHLWDNGWESYKADPGYIWWKEPMDPEKYIVDKDPMRAAGLALYRLEQEQ